MTGEALVEVSYACVKFEKHLLRCHNLGKHLLNCHCLQPKNLKFKSQRRDSRTQNGKVFGYLVIWLFGYLVYLII